MGLIIGAIENAEPVGSKVCKRHELNKFRVQSEVRSIAVRTHVGCVVHMRPVDYVEVLIVGCTVVIPSLTGRIQVEGNCIFIVIHVGGLSTFHPALNDIVK